MVTATLLPFPLPGLGIEGDVGGFPSEISDLRRLYPTRLGGCWLLLPADVHWRGAYTPPPRVSPTPFNDERGEGPPARSPLFSSFCLFTRNPGQ